MKKLGRPANKGRADYHNKPHEVSDREIRNNLCKGLICKRCVCMDKCQWGIEAIKRGIPNPAEGLRGPKPKPEKAAEERRDLPTLVIKPIGMVDRRELMQILGVVECTFVRYRTLDWLRVDAHLANGKKHPIDLYWPSLAVERIAAGMTRASTNTMKRTMYGKQIIKMRERLEAWIKELEEKTAIHKLIVNGCPEAGIK